MLKKFKNLRIWLNHFKVILCLAKMYSEICLKGGVEEFLLSDAVQSESLGIIKRLQRQMFALLPKYCLTERQQKRLEQSVGGGAKEEEDADVASQMQIVIEEILANVVTLCRSLVSKPGKTQLYLLYLSQLFVILVLCFCRCISIYFSCKAKLFTFIFLKIVIIYKQARNCIRVIVMYQT